MRKNREKDEAIVPKLLAQQYVACPMLSQYDTLVSTAFCVEKCSFYDSIISSDTDSAPCEVRCLYPRKLKIYSSAG